MAAHPHSRLHYWTPTTVEELNTLIAITMAMALTRKNSIEDYWSNDEVLDTPFFRRYMTRNRYIYSCLHFQIV